ncbi:multiple sugar transport system substrate-binding protein [Hydrogenispora ethanolica]|jgi:ABC-type glycerol-3-phosphate transport system substrate-binding protein|uniref:Multiple sugar transport system substrate-binding protein n=1 Tax=Hydrogenispora ethanolica TaxID=1082276 RepID=A0A4R1SBY8_HYDET|nr:ABC transporter substrate-binding protein [Hydrogenispora ethanolica]TCL76540.1 multiple sugar transport system substrate-binding protein [Hydrogenispora ethanolica]
MKKLSLGLFLVLLSLVVIAASNPAVFAKAKAPVTISFWFPGADKVNDSYFIEAAKSFEKTHPQIRVEVTVLPATQADVDLKLNAALLGGTYPDVLSAYLANIGTRGSQGDFFALDKFIRGWSDKNDIYDSVYDIGKYRNKILGLGYYPNPEVLVYRKDFFKEAGLDPNRPPTNWEELAAYAKKLTLRDNSHNVTRAGLDIPAISSNVFMKPFFRQNGALVVNEKKGQPMLDDTKMIGALDFIIKLKNENVSIPFNYQKKETIPFLYGKSAMSFLQPTQIIKMMDSDPSLKDKIGLAPVLSGKKKSAFCGYRLFTIGNTSKHKNEAWEFIQFMMSKEQMRYRFVNLKIPVVRKSMEDDFIAAEPAFNKVLMDYVKYGQGDNVVAWNTLAVKYIHQAYEEAYNGIKKPDQALKDAQRNLLRELKHVK